VFEGEAAMNFSLQDINEIVRNNEIKDYIKSFEEDFERTLDKIAKDAIEGKHGDKIVLLAGPSSSGKTTFAKKLVLALKKNGVDSKLISLDNFYLPVDKMPRNEKGKPDMESVFALDLTDAAAFFSDLFETHKATMPIFDFKEQTAPRERETIDFSPGTILWWKAFTP
jgi:uridine kinase